LTDAPEYRRGLVSKNLIGDEAPRGPRLTLVQVVVDSWENSHFADKESGEYPTVWKFHVKTLAKMDDEGNITPVPEPKMWRQENKESLTTEGLIKRGTSYAKYIDAIADVFGEGITVGEHNLDGEYFWAYYTNYTQEWDKEGKYTKKGCFFPERLPTPDELALVGANEAPKSKTVEYTPEDIEAIVAVISGKKGNQARIAAMKSDLPTELKNAVTSGAAFKVLEDQGFIKIAEDGVILDAVNV
jgi:hypothetical protein